MLLEIYKMDEEIKVDTETTTESTDSVAVPEEEEVKVNNDRFGLRFVSDCC
jgi:hypothetical protein